MRIRALEVRNWGCIESLTLSGLGDGIALLHGPNRVGKSSLVQAIRSGLFDHFHDSEESVIRSAVPWKTKATPSVVIEFEHAGVRYRISKSFAKGRGGFSKLEQHGAVGWYVLEQGKEAAKKVRALVGADSSQAGVYQMLWLGQRDFTLPMPRDVDPGLAKALEAVLGTLITGRDLEFKDRLDNACERWFTEKTMNVKRSSHLAHVESELEEAEEHKAESDREWEKAEAALRNYDQALAEQPALAQSLEQTEKEYARLGSERQSIAVRKSQYDLAVKHRDAEERQRRQAEQELRGWEQTEERRLNAEKGLVAARLQIETADERLRFATSAADQAKLRVEQAERDLAQHQQTRAAIDDRRQLAHLCTQAQALDRGIEQVRDWTKVLQETDAKHGKAPILSAEEIDRLGHEREEARRLRAQLEAAEIQIVVEAHKPLEGTIALDNQPPADVMLFARTSEEWRLRRQAELKIDKVASIRIRRAKNDRDLDETARRLNDLERSYRDALTAAQVDPEKPGALEELTLRRLESEALAAEQGRLRDAINRAAPQGLPALESQRGRLRQQTDAILARRPELHGWTPDSVSVEQLRADFDDAEKRLLGNVDAAKKALALADQAVAAEKVGHQTARDQVARLSADLASATESLAQRDRPALALAVDEAKSRLADAQARVAEATLTDVEQEIEAHYQAALQARNQADQRVRANDLRLEGLRVELGGTEGLHQRRIQAEQTVTDLRLILERETLYADAHKHLKELFEEVRNEQVGRTVGPINDRVMAWAGQLGLTDYAGLSFGDQLLPDGLVLNHAANIDPVELDCESYGTLEQLSLLIRLAVGGLLAQKEPAVAILDDPLAHADPGKHRRMLEILKLAAAGDANGLHPTGPLQLIILTCHEERFADLAAQRLNLADLIRRG